MVKVSREQAAANRDALLDAAGRLFRERGVDGVGVAELCKAAGVTHSVLYARFGSKDGLAAAAFRRGQTGSAERLARFAGRSPDLAKLLSAYVSPRQRDNFEQCCPMLASASEAARQGPDYQAAFVDAFDELAGSVGKSAEKLAGSREDLIAAAMIGAVAMARALKSTDPARSERLLSAARELLPALAQA